VYTKANVEEPESTLERPEVSTSVANDVMVDKQSDNTAGHCGPDRRYKPFCEALAEVNHTKAQVSKERARAESTKLMV